MALALLVAVATTTRDGTSRPPSQDAPLELLSMHRAREGDTLTIAGLVRSPADYGDIGRLSAVVSAFARDGMLIGSGMTSIDVAKLRPGEETPFTISLRGAQGVERYRVTFRDARGVVPHLDRRGDARVIARNLSHRRLQ